MHISNICLVLFWWLATFTQLTHGVADRNPQNRTSLKLKGDHLSFEILPKNAPNYYTPNNFNVNKNESICIILNTELHKQSQELVFGITVQEVLPYKIDFTRFGGISSEKGKQKLYLTVFGLRSGNLLQSTRDLLTGTTLFQLNPDGENDFEFCFQNLVFDRSWNSINAIKLIKLFTSANDILNPELNKYLETQYTSRAEKRLHKADFTLSNIQNNTLIKELLPLESSHRDINEDIFSRMLNGFAALVFAVIVTSLIQLRFLYLRLKEGRKDRNLKSV